MTSISIHKEHIKEHIQELRDAITIGIEQRPATLGLHTSACSISLLELYLHKLEKIQGGTMIKHEWFKEPQIGQKIIPVAERKITAEFPHKEKIFKLLYIIENNRNKLIYGKPILTSIQTILEAFQKLHAIIKEELAKKGEDIETL
ncbi:hypothetical protein HY483_00595 [Candidatus Woesearchaeota archaeon]|nr:hypothetical protein [Candidatus Woesearchaeota archaeon]